MLIFKYARDGTLDIDGLKIIAGSCDVSVEGVGGAKTFFEAKVIKPDDYPDEDLSCRSKYWFLLNISKYVF